MFWLVGGWLGILVKILVMVCFVIVKVLLWRMLLISNIFIIWGMLLVVWRLVVMYLLEGLRLYSIGILWWMVLKLFKFRGILMVLAIVSRWSIVLVEFFMVIIMVMVFLKVFWVRIWLGKICFLMVFIKILVDFLVLLVFFLFIVVMVEE